MAISDAVSKAKQSVGLERPAASEIEGPVRTVHDALRAIGEGDWDGFCGTLKEDVEWIAPGGDFPGGGNLSGRDAVREKFVGTIERTYATFGFVPDSFVDAPDDEVIAFGTFECEGRKGGSRVTERGVLVWKLDGDEAEEVRVYTDSAPFPEALSEDDERELESEIKDEEQQQDEQGDQDDQDDGAGDGGEDDGNGGGDGAGEEQEAETSRAQ
jgi:ketosteroid isomerase-like protein